MSTDEEFIRYDDSNAEFNRLGQYRNIYTKKPLSKRFDPKYKRVRVLIKNSSGKPISLDLMRIIAEMFVPRTEEQKEFVPYLIDGNPCNLNVNNVIWKSRSEIYFEWREKYKEAVIRKFKIPAVDPDENKWFILKECEFKPGYYYLPFVQTYLVVNRKGDVFNLVKECSQNLYRNKKGYLTLSIPWAEDQGIKDSFRYHRLLSLVFHKKPEELKNMSFDILQVNHIDADKQNNNIDNLEWTTHKGNLDHARALGLFSSEIAVLEKDIHTNEITRHQSLSSLARLLNIQHTALTSNLKDNWLSVVPNNGKVYKYDDGGNWPVVAPHGTYCVDINRYRKFMVRDVITGIPFYFNTIKGCCDYLNLSTNSFKLHLQRKGRDVPFKNYVVENFNGK